MCNLTDFVIINWGVRTADRQVAFSQLGKINEMNFNSKKSDPYSKVILRFLMKIFRRNYVIIVFFFFFQNSTIYGEHNLRSEFFKDPIEVCLRELESELSENNFKYYSTISNCKYELVRLKSLLKNTNKPNEQLKLLIRIQVLRDSIDTTLFVRQNEATKIRYLKGIQIIKILYEKILALDHHFTSINVFGDINKLSNPNNYSEFTIAQNKFTQLLDKKKGFKLTEVLNNNLFTSILYSLISLFNNTDLKKSEKMVELKKVECIIDFTLQMKADLDIIYFETVYLQKSNDEIIIDLKELFKAYTKPINYDVSLASCRENDDWDAIITNLNEYIEEIKSISDFYLHSERLHRMQVDITFPIDQLTQFINRYNIFINQSAKFYEKFDIMLNSYENNEVCSLNLPNTYLVLKEDIHTTGEKFTTAYKPIEINGSKLKQLLYGLSEYD